jgi:hypothetical protein
MIIALMVIRYVSLQRKQNRNAGHESVLSAGSSSKICKARVGGSRASQSLQSDNIEVTDEESSDQNSEDGEDDGDEQEDNINIIRSEEQPEGLFEGSSTDRDYSQSLDSLGDNTMISNDCLADVLISDTQITSSIPFIPPDTSPTLDHQPSERHVNSLEELGSSRANVNNTFARAPLSHSTFSIKSASQISSPEWAYYNGIMKTDFNTSPSSELLNNSEGTAAFNAQLLVNMSDQPKHFPNIAASEPRSTVYRQESSSRPSISPTSSHSDYDSKRNHIVLEGVNDKIVSDIMSLVAKSDTDVTMHFYKF